MSDYFISFFSGTGNSKKAALDIKKEILKTKTNADVIINDIEKPKQIPNETDHFMFIFPVYSFGVPKMMRDYLSSMPAVQNKHASVLVTCAGDAGGSGHMAKGILKKKGYKVTFLDSIIYPSNYTLMVPAPNEETVKKIDLAAEKRIGEVVKTILSGEEKIRRVSLFTMFLSNTVGGVFLAFGRRFSGKWFVATDKCVSCKLCENTCPAKTIKPSPKKPRWRFNCHQCNRCINICPKHAIQTSLLRLLSCAGLFFVPYGRFFGLSWAMTALVQLPCYLAAFMITDRILFFFEKRNWLKFLVFLAHNKNFRRYVSTEFKTEV
jgi:NAD-dependent dihydropyrimidine dehydrogenase PreA subunit/flavodoxin